MRTYKKKCPAQTALTGGTPWRTAQHAVARQCGYENGGRMARAAAWSLVQERGLKHVASSVERSGADSVRMLRHFVPLAGKPGP